MRQAGGRLGFTREALADFTLKRQLRRQRLDRHPAVQSLVAGAINHAHPAATDFSLDGVRLPECRFEQTREGGLIGFGHLLAC